MNITRKKMLTKTRHKLIDNKGIRKFKVKKDVTLPLLTDNPQYCQEKTTFMSNSEFEGLPVYIEAVKMEGGGISPYINGEGFIMVKDYGLYFVPQEHVESAWFNAEGEGEIKQDAETVQEAVKEVVSDVKKEIPSKEKVEKVTGLSIRQLLTITVIGILIAKLVK